MHAIHSFHAHIYFDPLASRAIAEAVRDDIAGQFAVRLGRWHDVPVGPHDIRLNCILTPTRWIET